MKIDLRETSYDKGAYGLVIFIENKSKAIKIFNRSHQIEQAMNVFNSECEAYEKASSDPNASSLTPQYFGKITIDEVIDQSGKDITNMYYTKLAYVMSYEEGPFFKFNTIPEPERRRIKEIMEPIGVNYLVDCSVSLSEKGQVNCIIDFATEEFEVWA